MKEKNYKEQEQDKQRGKKKYRERLAQEREAEQEIKEFTNENIPDASDTDRQYGERLIRR